MRGSWWLLLACVGCVSRSSYDEVVRARDEAVRRGEEATTRAAGLEGEIRRLRQDIDGARARADAAFAEARRVEAERLRDQLGLGPKGRLDATIVTGLGDIRCELWPDVAPLAVGNFVGLAEGTREWTDPRTGTLRKNVPLYSGTVFHRVIKGFMAQGGDPKGDGSGGPGYTFRDEIDPAVTFSEPGMLAMANAGPDSNGSQFFVTTGTPTHLDGKHTIFGRCETAVVERIMDEPALKDPENMSAPAARPVKPVRIERVVITRRP